VLQHEKTTSRMIFFSSDAQKRAMFHVKCERQNKGIFLTKNIPFFLLIRDGQFCIFLLCLRQLECKIFTTRIVIKYDLIKFCYVCEFA
jgi:hypothetical protein